MTESQHKDKYEKPTLTKHAQLREVTLSSVGSGGSGKGKGKNSGNNPGKGKG